MYLTLTSLTDQPQGIYGHGSPCTKDIFYDRLAGTHFHLADVIDKPEHARKRKVLSSAYALKSRRKARRLLPGSGGGQERRTE